MSMLYVTTPGSYVRKNGGRIVVTLKDRELASIPIAAVDGIVLYGPIQISTQALHELLESGIPLTLLSRGGRFLGNLQPGMPKNVFVRLAQQEVANHSELGVENARQIVLAKTHSQSRALSLWRGHHWLEDPIPPFPGSLTLIEKAPTVSSLQLAEAQIAKTYYALLGHALPPAFEWRGRTRRPPRDPVNALLSLTYMATVGEAVGACYSTGLDPFIGFLHQLDYGRPSLALDLIEPLRPRWCDCFVMSLLQQDLFTPDDFSCSATNGCRLTPESLPRFFKAYSDWAGESPNGQTLRATLAQLTRSTADSLSMHQPFNWTPYVEAVA